MRTVSSTTKKAREGVVEEIEGVAVLPHDAGIRL
jgi:hypothetical protein